MEKKIHLIFVIDKLTNYIQNTISGNSFPTEISRFTKSDFKQIAKKYGWEYNWKQELDNITKVVYKLRILNSPTIIQGLVSFSIRPDHIYMELLESSPSNLGRNKLSKEYHEILLLLLVWFHFNKDLTVSLLAQPKRYFIERYEKYLGAYHCGKQLMIIHTKVAKNLIVK